MRGLSIASIVLGACGLLMIFACTYPDDFESLQGWLFILGAYALTFGIIGVVKTKK